MSHSQEADPVDILLVEDNPGDIRLTQEAFDEGHFATTLHVVENGIDALDFCYQRGSYADAPRPDLVLLDLNLPRKNGDEVLLELREDPEFPPIPIVILTSSEDDGDVVQSYDLRANAYLTKPIKPDDFIDTIHGFEKFWLSAVRLPDVAP